MPDYKLGRLKGRYVVTWWDAGKRKRYRLDANTRVAAEAEAVDRIRREHTAPRGQTVGELWDAYLAEKSGRPVVVTMTHEWKALGPHFGELLPAQVSVDVCRAYTAKRRKVRIHDGTIWTELGHLRTVFVWAHRARLIPFAPAVERPAKPAPKDRWLNDKEIAALLDAPMAHHIRLAVLLLLSTAARIGAVLELRWERIDFEAGKVDLRASDIGPRKGRAVVPMNDGLRAALTAAKAIAVSDYVIEWGGEPVASIKTGFRLAMRAAGLKGVTPHTLRHTAAVHLAAGGASMEKISQYLGHSNTAITSRVYARFAPEHLKEEAAILDFAKPRQVR